MSNLVFRITNLDKLQAKLEVTLSIKDWKKFMEQLDHRYPSHLFLDGIRALISDMLSEFYGKYDVVEDEREFYRTLLLQLIGSLTLCDHMGDVADDVDIVLKKIDLGDLKWYDWHELRAQLGRMGITTIYGTALYDE